MVCQNIQRNSLWSCRIASGRSKQSTALIAGILILGLGFPCLVKGNPTEENPEAISFRAQGHAARFDRSRSFKIANEGNWGNIVLRRQDGYEDALAFNRDTWGGGYEIGIVVPRDPWNFEVEFSQDFSRQEYSDSTLPGFGAGALIAMPFIDISPHASTSRALGFFVSANAIAGRNSPATIDFSYEQEHTNLGLYAGYDVVQSPRGEISFYGGPAYANFYQDFRIETSGNNAVSGGITTSATDEDLDEHLFGGRVGVRGQWRLWKNLFLKVQQGLGLFARHSRLEAAQSIGNGAGNLGGGTTFTNLNERITVRQRDSGFVSQFETYAGLEYQVSSRMNISFFYEYEAWLKLSRIENPIVTSNLTSILNGPVSIEDGETARSHLIGGEITLRF